MRLPPIVDLLPQSGAMVLIGEIVAHDERRLACRAQSHRAPDHPLAFRGRLPVWAGIEYAAQAMAAHRALHAERSGRGTIGLLGALRNVRAAVDRLDDIDGALLVTVDQLSRDASGSIYAFRVTSERVPGVLLEGRATVVHREG